nr:uncharacterized protein LOC104118152 [Nicotiana tomentosiformis]
MWARLNQIQGESRGKEWFQNHISTSLPTHGRHPPPQPYQFSSFVVLSSDLKSNTSETHIFSSSLQTKIYNDFLSSSCLRSIITSYKFLIYIQISGCFSNSPCCKSLWLHMGIPLPQFLLNIDGASK